MKKFLLLRSNKQSGPYSTEDLQQMGLKPYDLIWVDGKSAAWRYPGEIEELKSFAPPVEEQPYDRFYKKHTTEANGKEQSSAPIETSPVSQPPAQQQQPVEKPARKKEYKRVFVTLPSGTTAQQPVPKPAAETKTTTYQPPVQEPKQSIPEPKPAAFKQSLPAEDVYDPPNESYQPKTADRPAENKSYAQPKLATPGFAKESVKENQSEIYYPKKRRFSGVPLAAMIIGMVVMAAIGVFVGMSLNGNQPFSLIKKVDPVSPVNNNQQSATPTDPRKSGTENGAQAAAQIVEDTATEVQKQVAKSPIKKNTAATDTNQQDVATNVPIKEEPEITKDEEPAVKKEVPKPAPELDKMVFVSNNDFEVGPFGGISRLALTLKNSSEYELSLVVVQLEYLKANKEVYKTENLYFRDVAANSTVTLDAPRSSRGNKINYRVTLINSKDHIYHAGN